MLWYISSYLKRNITGEINLKQETTCKPSNDCHSFYIDNTTGKTDMPTTSKNTSQYICENKQVSSFSQISVQPCKYCYRVCQIMLKR